MNNKVLPILLVIAGPAGSGKTTLCQRLCEDQRDFERVVTATTRPKRPDEIDKVHYHFMSPGMFRRCIDRGDFLEWTKIHGQGNDRLYGTLKSSILGPLICGGPNLILAIDVKGVESLRNFMQSNAWLQDSLYTVFIRVPIEVLRARMRTRGTESDEEISRRIETAEQELLEADKFDFVIESRSMDSDFTAFMRILREIRQQNLIRSRGQNVLL